MAEVSGGVMITSSTRVHVPNIRDGLNHFLMKQRQLRWVRQRTVQNLKRTLSYIITIFPS